PETKPKSAAEIAMQDAYGLALAANGTLQIPCARYVGQPMAPCAANVTRKGTDKADVTVTWPDGGSRVISFDAGLPASSDAGSDFRFTREGSLNMIRIGVSERFEIMDTVVLGD
ncbi:MAG: SH3 domain-containing protein, partial [Mesorhizobium sp.]